MVAHLAHIIVVKKPSRRDFFQFLRFMFCSQLAWLADVSVFALCYECIKFHYIPSKAISYSIGAVVSYLMNRKLTFGTSSRIVSSALARFLLVNCAAITLSLSSMYLFNEILGLPVWMGYFLSIIFSFSTNFLGNRFWVFRKH